MKVCESCKKEFSCFAEQGSCWCEKLSTRSGIPSQYKDCLCEICIKQYGADATEDFYYENGFIVFTRAYHLKRGVCCESNCRHCPYRS